MPFSETTALHTEPYWTAHFEQFLKPLIEGTKQFEARRSAALRGDLRNELIADLITSTVVVADLTDRNPNVYWELGVRQSFRHGTITIAEAGTQLPFDVSSKGTLFYHPSNHLRMEAFRADFRAALQSCLDEPNRPDSTVLEGISGRGSLYELIRRDEAIRRVEALISELQFNVKIMKQIGSTIKENREKRAAVEGTAEVNFSYHAVPLRSACLELLVTTRYLDLDSAVYKRIEAGFGRCTTTNQQLLSWESHDESTENYLQDIQDKSVELFDKLTAAMGTTLVHLKSRR